MRVGGLLLLAEPALVSAVVLAFEFGFVRQEFAERDFAVEGFIGERLEEVGAAGGVVCGEEVDPGGQEDFLMEAHAAEAPFGIGHFPDEALRSEVGGGKVCSEFVEELLVGGGVVAGQEDGLGAETVAEVVLRRASLALGGAGSGGALSVGEVGGDLGGGSHEFVPSWVREIGMGVFATLISSLRTGLVGIICKWLILREKKGELGWVGS
jgi:hypothetical protein